ncbi:alpha/beta hydrolase [Thauera aromatica]|uniref:alpha/beta fold hydrolase n=1 Tax=Thauera aromatica TaxID=59405 RepID=UPI0031ED6F5B
MPISATVPFAMTAIEVDGRRAALTDDGLHTAPRPLLLIHGAGHDHGVRRAVASGLVAAGRRVIAPDLPGHGASAGPALTGIPSMAAWVLALADALGLERFALGGHSMGALVALATAAAAPERITALALLGCRAPMPVASFLLEAARTEPAQAHALINKFSFAPAERIGETRRQALEAANLERLQAQPATVLAIDLAACDLWPDGLAAAAHVRCPTLLLCAAYDRMTPAETSRPLLQALQAGCDARLLELPDCGHGMLDEAPAAVIEALCAPG